MRGLARQLAFVPEATARRQLTRIDAMFGGITESTLLRWGEVVKGITGFAPHSRTEADEDQFVGEALRHDLRELSLRLSARAPETASSAMTIPALASSWRVSERTIHRWRKLGLQCCMMRDRGTGLAIGVRRRDAEAFRSRFPQLVPAARRARMTDAARREVIRLAKEAAGKGERRVSVAAGAIAARTGVGRETVRKFLVAHTSETGGALRGRTKARPGARERALVHSARGGGTSAIARQFSITTSSADRLSRTARTRAIVAMAAAALPGDSDCPASFARADAREVLLGQPCVREGLVPLAPRGVDEWIALGERATAVTPKVASARLLACRYLLATVQARVAALPRGPATVAMLDELERDLRWACALAGAMLRDAIPAIVARVAVRGRGQRNAEAIAIALSAAADELASLVAHAPIEQLARGRVRVDQSIALAADATLASGRTNGGRDPLGAVVPWSRLLRVLPKRVGAAIRDDGARRLWSMRLGLDGNAPMTIAEVAAAEGMGARTLSARLARSLGTPSATKKQRIR